MMCPSGVMMTPAPEPGVLGTRSGVNSRPFPVRLMGKRLTTEGLAASANSVMTVCISSRSRKPLDVLGRSPGGSAPLATQMWWDVLGVSPGAAPPLATGTTETTPAIATTNHTTIWRRDRMKASVPQVDPKTYKADGAVKIHAGRME